MPPCGIGNFKAVEWTLLLKLGVGVGNRALKNYMMLNWWGTICSEQYKTSWNTCRPHFVASLSISILKGEKKWNENKDYDYD